MRLFFDTETSGLWRGDLPPDHPSQPNLVQLGAKLFDAKWECTAKVVVLIRPDGWSIEQEAEAHHGISEARCNRHGVPLVAALSMFQAMTENARQIVAHNANFDRGVIRASLERVGAQGLWWQKRLDHFVCTMEAATPVCQLPGEFGRFKFPSLEEAHRHLYPGEPYETQHDAEEDLDATVRVFRGLEPLGAVPQPYSGRG